MGTRAPSIIKDPLSPSLHNDYSVLHEKRSTVASWLAAGGPSARPLGNIKENRHRRCREIFLNRLKGRGLSEWYCNPLGCSPPQWGRRWEKTMRQESCLCVFVRAFQRKKDCRGNYRLRLSRRLFKSISTQSLKPRTQTETASLCHTKWVHTRICCCQLWFGHFHLVGLKQIFNKSRKTKL